jgi:predicted ester cyclase
MDQVTDREELAAFYRRYNAACNAHDFDRLGEFVATDVVVDGEQRGLEGYQESLRRWVRAFPDYRWEILHLLVDGQWVAGHFRDTGTHRGEMFGVEATGRQVDVQEFAVYRVQDGRIAEVWGTADNLELRDQLLRG